MEKHRGQKLKVILLRLIYFFNVLSQVNVNFDHNYKQLFILFNLFYYETVFINLI